MKERPILFSAPMVCALIASTKTQTRRPVKGLALEWLRPDGFTPAFVASPENHVCPYGVPGDRLAVRETFFAFGRWETRFSRKKKRDEWHFVDMTLECGHQYAYVADGHASAPHQRTASVVPTWWKRPAIFMPRVACRLVLEVTQVRVERLQDISVEDCFAEGIQLRVETPAKTQYARLWDDINGADSAIGWTANPWVWAVSFRRIES